MNPIDNNSPFNGPLTPHSFRHHSNQNAQPLPKTKAPKAIMYAPIAIAGLALLVLPLTISQINTQQDIRQRASQGQNPPAQTEIVAIVNGENVTLTDVDLEYTRQQGANTYLPVPSALKEEVLNSLIERKIIEMEAEKRGITVSDNEVTATKEIVADFDPILASNTNAITDIIRRHKLAGLLADSRVLNVAYSSTDSAQSLSFMELIREQAENDGNLIAAALPYSRQSNDVSIIENVAFTQDNYLFTPDNTQEVFELETNEISPVISDNGKLFIVELLTETLGEYRSLNDFLEERKSQVQIL